MLNSLQNSSKQINPYNILKKQCILKMQLKDSIHIILEIFKQDSIVQNNENSNELCDIFEAIFLHGIKCSVFSQVVLSRHLLSLNFWSLLKHCLHKTTLKEISQMKQIRTNTGRCRCWLRLSLNQNLLFSYLNILFNDNKLLFEHYLPFAFLQNAEHQEFLLGLVQSLNFVKFDLACNSSLLNKWSLSTLILIDAVMPTESVNLAEEVLPCETLESSDFETDLESLCSVPNNIDSDKMFDIIITPSGSAFEEIIEENKNSFLSLQNENEQKTSHNGSLIDEKKPECVITEFEESFNIVLSEHKKNKDIESTKAPAIKSIFEQNQIILQPVKLKSHDTSEVDYEFLSFESSPLLKYLDTLQKEKGLDFQNYQCVLCRSPIGLFFGPALYCEYDGSYYCKECQEMKRTVIPSKLIHNWDFNEYYVPQYIFDFLQEIESMPLLNIRLTNPLLYWVIDDLTEVHQLRVQLVFLRIYLITCKSTNALELRSKMWPQDHLYEHVHMYSLSDILRIPNGVLAKELKQNIELFKYHVYNCELCSQKGFICEGCRNSDIIYPFNIEDTQQCKFCLALYHKICFNVPCSKCQRKAIQKAQLKSDL